VGQHGQVVAPQPRGKHKWTRRKQQSVQAAGAGRQLHWQARKHKGSRRLALWLMHSSGALHRCMHALTVSRSWWMCDLYISKMASSRTCSANQQRQQQQFGGQRKGNARRANCRHTRCPNSAVPIATRLLLEAGNQWQQENRTLLLSASPYFFSISPSLRVRICTGTSRLCCWKERTPRTAATAACLPTTTHSNPLPAMATAPLASPLPAPAPAPHLPALVVAAGQLAAALALRLVQRSQQLGLSGLHAAQQGGRSRARRLQQRQGSLCWRALAGKLNMLHAQSRPSCGPQPPTHKNITAGSNSRMLEKITSVES